MTIHVRATNTAFAVTCGVKGSVRMYLGSKYVFLRERTPYSIIVGRTEHYYVDMCTHAWNTIYQLHVRSVPMIMQPTPLPTQVNH